jgi:thiol-disulfide isomerase/thioredoxin
VTGKTLVLVSLVVVLFSVGAYICFANNVDVSPVVGKLAQDFELNSIEGKKIRLSDFRGTPVMLNFWATWCGYCVMEMPDMQAVFRETQTVPEEERVEILSINLLQSERNGLKDVKACVKQGKEIDMESWIYDEDMWPSGFAERPCCRKYEHLAK